jgi:hypothetical protein
MQATRQDECEPTGLPDQSMNTPEPIHQTVDTPVSENHDATYVPPVTPRSRRELRPTRTESPITRLKAQTTPS